MSLIAFTAAALLSAQTPAAAPRLDAGGVARLERCVFDGEDMSNCGDFSSDVEALEACVSRTNLSGGAEAFVAEWAECDGALTCMREKPQPDQISLHLRNCSARGVAASKTIAARWRTQLDGRLTPEERALMAQVRKTSMEGLELPAASDDPLRASGRWSGAWTAYLQFLRIVQLTGKAGL